MACRLSYLVALFRRIKTPYENFNFAW